MSQRFTLTTGQLRLLAIILPLVFWSGVMYLRSLFLDEQLTLQGNLFELAAIAAGAALFSLWIFRTIEEREAEIRLRSEQLTALHGAAIALTTELDLSTVLQKVVDLARELVGARYGALGVLQEDGQFIEQFITVGISPEQRAALGELPRGHGLLGALIHEGKAIRIPSIGEDERSVGFPPNHPPMKSLLGVPIRFKGRVMGDLYMTDKLAPDGSTTTFTSQDEEVLEMFATQAAIAIENAQLYRQKQQLAVLQERERFGMDLHDGIIQSIYAVGLMLEDTQHESDAALDSNPRAHVGQAITSLNEVIRDIRNYILDLRPQRFQGRDLTRGLEELAREFRANTFMTVNLVCDGLEANLLTPEQTVEILHIAQEALTNIRKHARASIIQIDLIRDADAVVLEIQDNGSGLDAARSAATGGHGLKNMRERARALGGELDIEPGESGGTRVTLSLPIPPLAA
jgi:two-component system, NarL family, sensor histidine kinase DevS